MGRLGLREQFTSLAKAPKRDHRPADHFARFHALAREQEPGLVYDVVSAVCGAWASFFCGARWGTPNRLPQLGPMIVAPNHGSLMDPFLATAFVAPRVHFMAKSQLFQPPAQWLHTRMGAFPVRQGYNDEEAMITARAILERGGVVGMYCEGGRTRDGQLRQHPKPGIGRLALETGVHVVPIAIHGSSELRHWRRNGIPRLVVGCGDAVRWSPTSDPSKEEQNEVAEEILMRIKRLHAELGAINTA